MDNRVEGGALADGAKAEDVPSTKAKMDKLSFTISISN